MKVWLAQIMTDPAKMLSIAPVLLAVLAVLFLGLFALIRDGSQGLTYLNFLQSIVEWAMAAGGLTSLGHAGLDYLKHKNQNNDKGAGHV